MEAKKVKFDSVEKANEEMSQFLEQFPVEEPIDMKQTLTQLETDVISIRSHLMKKTKKVTMVQLNQKLDVILKILLQHGLTYQDVN